MDITVPSFAKLNLSLKVSGKRSDGYHELHTIFQTIDLCDHLTFQFEPGDFDISIDPGNSGIPTDRSNLIWRACTAFDEIYPVPFKIRVKVEKRIPVERGLGGGSSNAAASLIALSRLLGWPIERSKLVNIASNIGADVPFFLTGGTANGTGRGDQIRPLGDWSSFPILLVVPAITCSTTAIYRYYDEWNLLTATANSVKIQLDQRPESLRDLVSRIENDLEKVVFALYPELDSIKKGLIQSGAVAAGLTGSGSAVFGLFETGADLDKAAGAFPGSIRTRFLSRAEYERSLVIGPL